MIDIVGLGGSLAPQSASLAALNVALTGAREYGASVQLFDLPGGTRGWTLASSSNCARSATSSRAQRICSGSRR
jgi:hypothetical protein